MEVIGFTRQGLRASGFRGFVAVEWLDRDRWGSLPAGPGVLMVLRAFSEPPVFRKSDSDDDETPIVARDLRAAWVPGAEVLYIEATTDLRRSIGGLIESSGEAGTDAAARLWRLEDSALLQVVWKDAAALDDPRAVGASLVTGFERTYGRRPFAGGG